MNGAVELSERWPLEDATVVRDALLAAYADPGRGYHDTRHLAEVLDRLDELPGRLRPDRGRPRRVVPRRGVRRPRGRRGALRRLGRDGAATLVDPAIVDEVVRLVLLTEHHRPADDDPNGCALSDADLAILAAPPERYAEYVAAVRAEYAHVPDDAFAAGRAAILRDLLAKPHLFHTAYAREHWEAAARAQRGPRSWRVRLHEVVVRADGHGRQLPLRRR